MDSQLKKGVLEMCILHIIARQETYGYEIIRQAVEAFPDISESTVYAILRRLNTAKYTDIYYGADSGGPPRKYYRITQLGACYLDKGIENWKSLCKAVCKIIEMN